jgi:nitrate reductase gamma subunit
METKTPSFENEMHVKIIAWLYILLGILGILASVFVFAIVAGAGWISGDTIALQITLLVSIAVAGFLAVISIPGVLVGFGLLFLQPWARVLAMVLAVLNLANIPFGTALGIYALIVLLHGDTAQLFAKH